MMLLWVALALVVVLHGYIRLSPPSIDRWHADLKFNENKDLTGITQRVIPGSESDLLALDQIIRATPRTVTIAGTVVEKHLTYETRSWFWRFPDYTTVQLVDGQIRFKARPRFGLSDFGVNRARVETWINALQAR